MGAFDDLPEASATAVAAGPFDDLPNVGERTAGPFDDLPDARTPRLSQANPEGLGRRALRAVGESLTPLIGPSEDQKLRDAVGIDDQGQPIYKPMGSAIEREGFLPAMSKPFVAIPRMTDETVERMARNPLPGAWAPPEAMTLEHQQAGEALVAGAYNTLAGFAEFMESPLGLATMGYGSAAARLGLPWLKRMIAAGYAVDMGRKIPEQAEQAGTLSVTGTPLQQAEAGLGLAASTAMVTGLGTATLKPGRATGSAGGELSEIANRQAPIAKTEPQAQPIVSEFGGQAETLTEDGKGQMANGQTPIAKTEVLKEPSPATGETAAGPFDDLPEAAPAADKTAGPSVILRGTVGEAIARREPLPVSWVEEFNRTAETALALPEGYTREGERFVFQAPEAAPSAEQQQAREAAAAMEALRQEKETQPAERADSQAPIAKTELPGTAEEVLALAAKRKPLPADVVLANDVELPLGYVRKGEQFLWRPAEAVAEGSVFERGERPPDLLDSIEEHFPGGVRLPKGEDFAEYARRARGKAREMLSTSRGEPIDRVMQALQLEGSYPGLDTPDKFAAAMLEAAEARMGWARDERAAKEKASSSPTDIGFKAGNEVEDPLAGKTGLVSGSAAEMWADKRIKEGYSRLMSGPDPELMAAYAVKGAAIIERGVRDFATWAKAMVRRFGETIRPQLETIFAEASKIETFYRNGRSPTGGKSYNFRDKYYEAGVSVYEAPEANSFAGLTERPWYRIKGVRIGYGSDGEPVVKVFQERRLSPKRRRQALEKWNRDHPLPNALPGDVLSVPKLERYRYGTNFTVMQVLRRSDGTRYGFKVRAKWLTNSREEGPTFVSADENPKIIGNIWDAEPKEEWWRRQDTFEDLRKERAAETALGGQPEGSSESRWISPSQSFDRFNPRPSPGDAASADSDATIRRSADTVNTEPAPARPYGQQDTVEILLAKAIEATARPKGELMEGVTGMPVWLSREAANAALRVARLAYVGTRSLAQAIAAAMDHLRGMNLVGFKADEAQGWLEENLKLRQRAETIEGSDVSDAVKASVADDALYTVRTHEQLMADARQAILEIGPEAATQAFIEGRGKLPEDTRTALGAALQEHFKTQERVARAKGDLTEADALAQRQVDLWRADGYGTELAQGLSARRLYDDMSAGAKLKQAQDLFDETGRKWWERQKPAVDDVKRAVDEGRRAAVEQVRQDPEVNTVARAAVDEAVGNSEATHKAIVMELAEPWAQSSVIMNHARAAVRAKADELLNKGPRPPGFTAPQRLRQILDDLAQRAAGIAAGHYQGAEPGVTLAKKLEQRLGIDGQRALQLARAFDKEWSRQIEAARKALPKRIAAARVANERNQGFAPDSPQTAVDAQLRRQLRSMNLKLGEVLAQEAAQQGSTGKTLAERVVAASGLTGEKAEALRAKFEQRFAELLKAEAERRLQAMERMGRVLPRKVRSLAEDLVKLTKLGALSDGRFYDLAKKKLGLPVMTDELAREITRRANDLEKHPKGNQRDIATNRLLNYVLQQRGLNWADVPMGMFYANILSGFTTPAKIVIENMNLLMGHTIVALLTHPGELLHPARFARAMAGAYGRGAVKGGLQAAATLKTGVLSGVWQEPRIPTVMELKPFGERGEYINIWKWFTRVISTSHETTFKPAWEIKQTLLARETARREGLRGGALERRVADLLADTPAHMERARSQALAELQATGEPLSKMDWARRTREILEQRREETMPGSTETARDFALRTSYLSEPYGFMGLVARGVQKALENARRDFPVLGTAVKAQIPFTTVISNILNEKWNWGPGGIARAVMSHRSGELYGRPMMDPTERAEMYAKGIAGTVAMGALAALFSDHIHGNGPGTPEKRKQLMATGWIPHSVEFNGEYHSYMHTPAGVYLAVLGNYLDWHRYGKGNEEDGVTRVAFALKGTLNAVISQGMLDSLKRLFESLGSESTSEGAGRLQKLLVRTGTSFLVPNLLQQVDRLFDPTQYDQTGVKALLTGQMPFARRNNRPTLTVLGDRVQGGPFHYWASQVSADPLLRTLAEQQAWVTAPSRSTIVGDRSKGPDHFRAITPDELYELVSESGPRIRTRLERALESSTLIADKVYPPLPDCERWQAQALVRRISEEEREKAKARLRLEP